MLITEAVEASDVVITMGCGDTCPIFPGKRYLDLQLDDPPRPAPAAPTDRVAGAARYPVPPANRREDHVKTRAPGDIRETVRARYAAAATTTNCCGTAPAELETDTDGTAAFGATLYGDDAAQVSGSLGCGVPTEVADLHPGETVLDLGSGATEMLDLTRANATATGVTNVEFLHGYREQAEAWSQQCPSPWCSSRSARTRSRITCISRSP